MRLKSFYAKTMTEAMKMVRDTLGDEAVIVATREEGGGKSVRVTAAIEQEDRYGDIDTMLDDMPRSRSGGNRVAPNFEIDTVPATKDSGGGWLQYDEEDEEGAVVEQLTDIMLRHSVSDEITDQVISCATVLGMPRADEALTAAIEHLFSFRPLPQKSMGGTAWMVVGPPGAGKTLATAKIAARSVMAGLRVSVISTDTVRAGGIEQLSAFTKLLRVNLQTASGAKKLQQALEQAQGSDHILIDTNGMNPFNPEEMRDLARLMSAGDIEPVLVLPAGIDADESGEIGRIYAALGVRSILPTRIDIARRLGGLLGAAHHGGLIFADASHTPKVADGLIPLSPRRLTGLLMPQADKKQTSRRTRTG
jgi:flagellar biosynthesis protein FlhF